MLSDQMRRLFSYNAWAWQHVYVSVEQLDHEAYHAPRPLFNHSIHSILVHCMTAEYIWYTRCQGESPTDLFNPDDFADLTAVLQAWSPVRHSWANYLQWLSDEDCKQFVEYRNTSGTPFTLRLADLLLHVVNHATEHRSQLTPILYDLGVPTKPLDYMRYRLGL